MTPPSPLKGMVRFVLALATTLAILGGCVFSDAIDRCLDRGGRWNDAIDVCEFEPQGTNDATASEAPTTANLYLMVGRAEG